MTTTQTHPTLTGSPKQTAWADQIRTTLDHAIRDHINLTYAAWGTVAHQHIAPAIRAAALTQTDAKWWIDNRDRHPYYTLAKAAWRLIDRDERKAILATVKAAAEQGAA